MILRKETAEAAGIDRDLMVDAPILYIKSLDKLGELPKLFPALDRAKGVQQSEIKHNEGDVYIHTLMTSAKLSQTTPSDLEFGPVTDRQALFRIALALLYHDTGKRERNLHSTPENRVDHVVESVKHANEDLAKLLSPEELAIVVEMIAKHEILFSTELSWRLNKLAQLFSLGGDIENGRTLLKFLECDCLGRKVMKGHEYHIEKNARIMRRNIEIYKILLGIHRAGLTFPVQRISAEVTQSIKNLIHSES